MDFFFDNSQTFNDPNDRVDAKAKVTGAAKYSADFQFKNLAYGVFVQSTIAKGKIKEIDLKDAFKAAGIVEILTHKTAPKPMVLLRKNDLKSFI